MPLAQRALHHLFPGYPLGGFGDRPFPERCWRWSAGSWFDSMVVIEGNGVRKSGSPRTGLLAHLRLVTLLPPEGRKIVAQPTRNGVVHFPGAALAL